MDSLKHGIRELGQEGEQEQPQGVSFFAARMEIPFREKQAHDRKRHAAKHMASLCLRAHERKKTPADMIDQHCGGGQDFQYIPVEDWSPLVFPYHAFLRFNLFHLFRL